MKEKKRKRKVGPERDLNSYIRNERNMKRYRRRGKETEGRKKSVQ